MKKEIFIEETQAVSIAENPQVLRRLLHLRHRLGKQGVLSVIPSSTGVSITLSESIVAAEEGISEGMQKAEFLVREALFKSEGI